MKVGDSIKVIEKTYNGKTYEWDGVVLSLINNIITTEHSRCRSYTEFKQFPRAYEKTTTINYGLQNIRL